jgi:hypothetical protein
MEHALHPERLERLNERLASSDLPLALTSAASFILSNGVPALLQSLQNPTSTPVYELELHTETLNALVTLLSSALASDGRFAVVPDPSIPSALMLSPSPPSSPFLPPIPLLHDALPADAHWVWDLILRLPSLMAEGALHGRPVWLATVLFASDEYTVVDLLEQTDDGDHVSMRQLHSSPWRGPVQSQASCASSCLSESDLSAPPGARLETFEDVCAASLAILYVPRSPPPSPHPRLLLFGFLGNALSQFLSARGPFTIVSHQPSDLLREIDDAFISGPAIPPPPTARKGKKSSHALPPPPPPSATSLPSSTFDAIIVSQTAVVSPAVLALLSPHGILISQAQDRLSIPSSPLLPDLPPTHTVRRFAELSLRGDPLPPTFYESVVSVALPADAPALTQAYVSAAGPSAAAASKLGGLEGNGGSPPDNPRAKLPQKDAPSLCSLLCTSSLARFRAGELLRTRFACGPSTPPPCPLPPSLPSYR